MVSRVSKRRAERPRRRSSPPRRWGLALLLVGVVVALGWLFSTWRQPMDDRVTLAFAGAPAGLELTFFPDRLAFAAPSPPAPIGRAALPAAGRLTVGRELVPDTAVVRYEAPGIGTGYRHVRLGAPPPAISLRPPGVVRGRVVEPIAAWSQGWRCAELRPIAGAEVLVMGGGEHGVELARGTTDAQGAFEVEGFDRELDGLGLRVRAAGFALGHVPLTGSAETPTVALAPARPLRGRVIAPPAVAPATLLVLARNLPGVQAAPAADGTFVLDHVPEGVQPRLLLHGLPIAWTHAPVRGAPDVRIELVAAATVRGRVLDARTHEPLAGAMVLCGDDRAARAAADGSFELVQLPPGPTTIDARYEWREKRRWRARRGSRPIELAPGAVHDGVTVFVEAKEQP